MGASSAVPRTTTNHSAISPFRAGSYMVNIYHTFTLISVQCFVCSLEDYFADAFLCRCRHVGTPICSIAVVVVDGAWRWWIAMVVDSTWRWWQGYTLPDGGVIVGWAGHIRIQLKKIITGTGTKNKLKAKHTSGRYYWVWGPHMTTLVYERVRYTVTDTTTISGYNNCERNERELVWER